jgi:enoyl-CoA hydratase/carnithine racemase
MSKYQTVEYELDDGVATVRLDRPERMNALSGQLIDDLVDAVERGSEEARVVVVTGNGEAFCSGYDLEESGGTETGEPTVEELLDRYRSAPRFVHAIYDAPVPVIAAVDGYALAGGSDLALACDLTIASEEAEFGYPGVRMGGFPPTLVYPFVMGTKHSRELLFSGKRIPAEEAERMGMINRAVPHGDLLAEVHAEVDAIRKVPKTTVRILKEMHNAALEMQGYRPTVRLSELADALVHKTEGGKKFFEIRDDEGVEAAIEWMNEADKE